MFVILCFCFMLADYKVDWSYCVFCCFVCWVCIVVYLLFEVFRFADWFDIYDGLLYLLVSIVNLVYVLRCGVVIVIGCSLRLELIWFCLCNLRVFVVCLLYGLFVWFELIWMGGLWIKFDDCVLIMLYVLPYDIRFVVVCLYYWVAFLWRGVLMYLF